MIILKKNNFYEIIKHHKTSYNYYDVEFRTIWLFIVPVNNKSCFFTQEIMVGSMYQAETPVGLCKYKDNEKGQLFHLSECLAAQDLNYS